MILNKKQRKSIIALAITAILSSNINVNSCGISFIDPEFFTNLKEKTVAAYNAVKNSIYKKQNNDPAEALRSITYKFKEVESISSPYSFVNVPKDGPKSFNLNKALILYGSALLDKATASNKVRPSNPYSFVNVPKDGPKSFNLNKAPILHGSPATTSNKVKYAIGALTACASAAVIYKIAYNYCKKPSAIKKPVLDKIEQNSNQSKEFNDCLKELILSLTDEQWQNCNLHDCIIALSNGDFSIANNKDTISQLKENQLILLQNAISKYNTF